MSDIMCGYTGDRDAALMEYLFGEMTGEARGAFEVHLATCARCRTELAAFGSVRRQLAQWSPPDLSSSARRLTSADTVAPEPSRRLRSWRTIPAWAQVAAAMVVLGVSAGIANLDVHYDAQSGLSVRTGWSQRAFRANAATDTNPSDLAGAAPWRPELAALERQLRGDMHVAADAAPAAANASSSSDAELMRRVKALVDDSERRQQRELALRVTALIQDLNAQRQADLRRIDQNLGLIQDRTGVEVLKNRQMIDYYMQRVSQRP